MEGQLNFFLMHIKVVMNIINMGFRLVRLVTVHCTVYTLHAHDQQMCALANFIAFKKIIMVSQIRPKKTTVLVYNNAYVLTFPYILHACYMHATCTCMYMCSAQTTCDCLVLLAKWTGLITCQYSRQFFTTPRLKGLWNFPLTVLKCL